VICGNSGHDERGAGVDGESVEVPPAGTASRQWGHEPGEREGILAPARRPSDTSAAGSATVHGRNAAEAER
jgi:hypothetical protein